MTANFRHEQINVVDAAHLLGVRVSELKEAIRTGSLIRGVQPPKVRNQDTWVFTAGDVMDAAEAMKRGESR